MCDIPYWCVRYLHVVGIFFQSKPPAFAKCRGLAAQAIYLDPLWKGTRAWGLEPHAFSVVQTILAYFFCPRNPVKGKTYPPLW